MDGTTAGSSASDTTKHDTSMKAPAEIEYTRSQFQPSRCLFCNQASQDFGASTAHMQTAHGLFVPDQKKLVVDLETLFDYLHLVIFGYSECICCGTQRQSPHAAQQHMLDKGHCRFDPRVGDSEFADFYDFSEAENDNEDEAEEEAGGKRAKTRSNTRDGPVQPDDSSLRLSSGRIISHRSAPRKRSKDSPRTASAHLQLDGAASSDSAAASPATIPAAEVSLVPESAKRDNKLTMRLANLRESERQSIAHLPLPQQRAVVATQQRQTDKAKRVEKRYQSRVEGLGNMTRMKHFGIDADDGRLLRTIR